MPIRVECPHCGKGIKAPSKFAGKDVKCPGCKGSLDIPAALPTTPPALNETPEISIEAVDCPFCSEPIKPTAKKCKHCGEFLAGEGSHGEPHTATSTRFVRIIEATGKKWKLLQLISVIGIILGACTFAIVMKNSSGSSAGSTDMAATLSLLTFVGSFIVYILARVMAWWFHG